VVVVVVVAESSSFFVVVPRPRCPRTHVGFLVHRSG
jgi:hypothetical protein